MMEQFYYIDPSDNLYLLNDNQYRFLVAHSGLGLEGIEDIVERTPYRDGAVYRGLYAGVREIALTLEFVYKTQTALINAERALLSALNPYKGSGALGTLRIFRGGATRDIRAHLVKFTELSQDRKVTSALRTLIFRCPNPWFYDPAPVEESWAMPTESGISIPLSFPLSVQPSTATGKIYVTNDGDLDTYPIIRVDGPADNPQIENTMLDKKIAITQEMDGGDYIEIDMENATVKWWDDSESTLNSILENLSDDSEFWPLAHGMNEINVSVDNPAGGTIKFTYYLRYLKA